MNDYNKKLILRIRTLCVWMAFGIIILASESILTGIELFRHYAFGLAIFSLIMVSLMIDRIVKSED